MKNNTLNKALVAGLACMAVCGVAIAGPHGGPGGFRGGPPRGGFHGGPPRGGFHHGPGPGFRPPPPPCRPHYHHSFWGRGGRYFWPGFVGGVVGGAVYSAIAPDPVVVTTPAVVTTPTVVTTPAVVTTTPVTTVQNVWVEGRYVDQVQGNGTIVRIWQPGHYEQRTVYVQ